MDTYQIEIIEPKAKKLLDELVNFNLPDLGFRLRHTPGFMLSPAFAGW
jgi:hypothetical protein